MIPVGGSIDLQISFTPSTGGVRSNSLLIHNNSQNSPLFQIELTGTGIDDGTSLPSNVLLEILGNDVRLTWNQVLSDQWGNPFEPSGYLVFGSDRADTPIDDFLLISYTDEPIFIHRQIARIKDRMFYAVVALDAEARSKFTVGQHGMAAVDDREWLINALKKLGLSETKHKLSTRSLASLQVMYFEETVEEKQLEPHFHL